MEPKIEDLQAIRRLKRGDISGLECLIARYQQKALRTAFLITHDEPLAEDVVQDAFVRFYQRANFFDETRPFEPYFLRSVVNAALNCLEREKRGTSFTHTDTYELENLLEEGSRKSFSMTWRTSGPPLFVTITLLYFMASYEFLACLASVIYTPALWVDSCVFCVPETSVIALLKTTLKNIPDVTSASQLIENAATSKRYSRNIP